ncbi:MAG: Enolase [Microgenomates group bacterium GW2011_GWC1_37_8]|uniref:Enolase n=1 Tax=Candidatus Woesebacteria bacterium GW2011_GWB1_38_8 TaxID=1618570 RepID=A0A0G0NHC5_9BACT|nr:MAG: Enolase [Microgenomates group bacterium GW2011_GWC1_37_8]KKQ85289.1 MAG: Enolase [Candidatus Woesebacteria bacterium GW2011_GWB1_38_8]
MKITSVIAREILSSSSLPTIETKVILENGMSARASVPFGASSGKHEAITLVDNDQKRYFGKGMLNAVKNVKETIAPFIVGLEVQDQLKIDEILLSLDTSPQKEKLGGNSILSVSLACARAASITLDKTLYQHIKDTYSFDEEINILPKPMMVVIEGGKHADSSTDFQEYMFVATLDKNTIESIRAVEESYQKLGQLLKESGFNTNVGLEGAYAYTSAKSNQEPLGYMQKAVIASGYKIPDEIGIAIDPAASEFNIEGAYHLQKEDRKLSSDELIEYYQKLSDEYPIISIEDGLSQDDWLGWTNLNAKLGKKVMIVGDDLTVTNSTRLKKAIEAKAINTVIIKPNQVGTLSETIDAIKIAKKNGLKVVVSHRGGGETTDTFIIDLAVAAFADFVKVGPSRGERTEKYNRLMEIAEQLNL